MLPFFERWLKKKEVVRVSEIDSIIHEYRTLKLARLNKVFSSDMSIIRIEVCKDTIEQYGHFIKMITDAFEFNKQLTPLLVVNEIKSIYIRDFYIDSHKNYLRPIPATELFIEIVIKFLSTYQSAEKSVDKSFIIEKNLYLCGPVVSNLTALLKSLQSL